MFRQEPTQNFLSKLPPKIPVGPMVGTVVKNRNSGLLESAIIEIHPIHGTSSGPSATINIVMYDPSEHFLFETVPIRNLFL